MDIVKSIQLVLEMNTAGKVALGVGAAGVAGVAGLRKAGQSYSQTWPGAWQHGKLMGKAFRADIGGDTGMKIDAIKQLGIYSGKAISHGVKKLINNG